MRYSIKRDWEGQTVAIIGGGPSLPDPLKLPDDWKVIAINEAGLTRFTESDVLFFGDFRWFDWNRQRMKYFLGREVISRGYDYMYPEHIKVCLWDQAQPIHKSTNAIGGWCSGGSAIDLAYKRGAARIVLFGFDMHDHGADNWHDKHPVRPSEGVRGDRFVPSIESAAPVLKDAGVEVFNATPGSALKCFDFVEIEQLWPQP